VKRSLSIGAAGPGRQAWVFLSSTGCGTLIALLRLPLQDALHANAPFLLAWPGALLAAFLGGFWPAIIVTAVGAWVAQVVLTTNGLPPLGPGGLLIYSLFGLVFAIAGGLRKRGIRRAADDARRLGEMRAQLENVTRLNAMGEMAAALAHELNQPLTAMSNYVGIAQRLAARGDTSNGEVAEMLDKISGQVVRAGEIIARVRGYVTRGEVSARVEAVSTMFEEAAAVAMPGSARVGVLLRAEFDPLADQVLADRIQVQQVMVNLLRNAVEAMAGRPRRELRIGCRPRPDGFAQAYVADTGPGLDADIAERLFQPFVTGKAGGMGVGLAISRNIVESHGGAIWAEANAEGGTTFHFTLRRAQQARLS